MHHFAPCGSKGAANDETASLVLLAADRCWLSVPWDLAVAGIDNDMDLCETVHPSLTSVYANRSKKRP